MIEREAIDGAVTLDPEPTTPRAPNEEPEPPEFSRQ
jgi:hypothetical protein